MFSSADTNFFNLAITSASSAFAGSVTGNGLFTGIGLGFVGVAGLVGGGAVVGAGAVEGSAAMNSSTNCSNNLMVLILIFIFCKKINLHELSNSFVVLHFYLFLGCVLLVLNREFLYLRSVDPTKRKNWNFRGYIPDLISLRLIILSLIDRTYRFCVF